MHHASSGILAAHPLSLESSIPERHGESKELLRCRSWSLECTARRVLHVKLSTTAETGSRWLKISSWISAGRFIRSRGHVGADAIPVLKESAPM